MNPIILYWAIVILLGWFFWSIMVIVRLNHEKEDLTVFNEQLRDRLRAHNRSHLSMDQINMNDFNDSCDVEPTDKKV